MARGMPSGKSQNDTVPLSIKRLTRAPLIAVHAFRAEQESESKKTGEKYIKVQPKLSFTFDSGHFQKNSDGEVLYDDDTGEAKPHYIIDGFVTLSGFNTGNLVQKVLPAFGFDNPDWFDDDGNLTDEVMDSVDIEFGSNALGENYEGAEWDEIPLYVRGQKDGRKGDIEVEVTSFKIMGYELLGREVDLQIGVKDGWNRITAYLVPADFTSLEDEPYYGKPEAAALPTKDAAASKGAGKAKGAAKGAKAASGAPDEAQRQKKAATYTKGRLAAAKVPTIAWPEVLAVMLDGESVDADAITTEQATRFHAMAEGDEGIQAIQAAYEQVQAGFEEFPPEESLPF